MGIQHVFYQFWMQEEDWKSGVSGEKPAEATMEWKPNAHEALGLEPGTSLVQSEGTTTAITRSTNDLK